jgi:hypothetical protein
MATYYLNNNTGSDSANGQTPATAWGSFAYAVGATSGFASGDTLWIAPGEYRGSYQAFAMTSPVAETFIKGDVSGANPGVAPGDVILNGLDDGPIDQNGGGVDLAGRDNLTFEDLTFLGTYGVYADHTLAVSSTIKFKRCYLHGTADGLWLQVPFNTNIAWTFEQCYIWGWSDAFNVTARSSGAGADFNVGLSFSDCFLAGGFNKSAYLNVDTGGGSSFKPGGVSFLRCTMMGDLAAADANWSTTIPCTFQDCAIVGRVNANTAGQIIDSGHNIAYALLNVTQAASSRAAFPTANMPLSMGHEFVLWGLPARPAFSPLLPGALGIGSTPTTDLTGRSANDGGGEYRDAGTATAATATTLTDSSKAWTTNQHRGRLVRISGGTGAGQVKHISSNTTTQLTIGGRSGDWSTTPSTDSTYLIFDNTPAELGKATAGAATTMTDSGASWRTDQWAGYTVEIIGGTGLGQTRTIVSNTATALTVSAWGTNPDSTSAYALYRTANHLVQGKYPGAFQRHDTAKVQTAMLNGGTTGFVLDGYASQEFIVPVLPGATTVSVPLRYDSNHGATNKPQVSVVADGALGITATTSTMSAAVDTWETVAVTFTATKQGLARIRVQSRSGTPYGRLFIDGGAWRFGSAYGQRSTQFQLRPRTG